MLGRCLQLGLGIEKDMAKALAYFNKVNETERVGGLIFHTDLFFQAKRFNMNVATEMHDQLTHNQL